MCRSLGDGSASKASERTWLWFPSSHMKKPRSGGICLSRQYWGRRDKKVPWSDWPTCLAKLVSCRVRERPYLEKIRWKAIEENTHCWNDPWFPHVYVLIHTERDACKYTLHTRVRTHAHMQTHTHYLPLSPLCNVNQKTKGSSFLYYILQCNAFIVCQDFELSMVKYR